MEESEITKLVGEIVAKSVKDSIGTALDEKLKDINKLPEVPVVPQVEPQIDQTEAFLKPYIDKHTQRANFAADNATDKANFYAGKVIVKDEETLDKLPGEIEGITKEDAAELEKRFMHWVKEGRPISREALWVHMQGERTDKIVAKRIAKHDAAVKAAAAASDVGAVSTVGALTAEQAWSTEQDKLREQLAEVNF